MSAIAPITTPTTIPAIPPDEILLLFCALALSDESPVGNTVTVAVMILPLTVRRDCDVIGVAEVYERVSQCLLYNS